MSFEKENYVFHSAELFRKNLDMILLIEKCLDTVCKLSVTNIEKFNTEPFR